MATSKITWENKEGIQNDESIVRKNKVMDDDMNEIKQVVNNNADELNIAQSNIEDLQSGQSTSNADITNIKNRISTLETDNKTNKSDISALKSDNTTNKENISTLQEQVSNKVDKVEGKGLSTNDFTNEYKQKLDNLENYDDTETKEEIQEIKENITQIEEEQETQNTNIENLQENDTTQDELIEKLQQENNNIKSALINVETEEAKSLHIEDASEVPAQLSVTGNQEQETREGYNMLNSSLFDLSEVSNLATFNKEDGTITFNGTANTDINIRSLRKQIIAGTGKENIVIKIISGSLNGLLRLVAQDTDYNNLVYTQIGTSSFTNKLTENIEYNIFSISITSGTVMNNLKLGFMIVDDSNLDKEYEQYGATPSPKYPSEIKTVGNDINEFDKNSVKFEDGYYSTNGDFTESTSTNHTNNYTEIKENTNYTISGIKRRSGYNYPSIYAVYFYDSSKNWLGRTGVFYQPNAAPIDKWIEYTFKTPSNCKYLRFQCQKNEVNLDLDTIKLQKGIKSTNYSKYTQGTVGLTIFNKNVANNITYFNTKSQYNAMVNAEYYFEEGKNYRISFDTPNTGIQIYLQSEGDNTNYSTESWQSCYCDGNRHSFKVTARKTKNTKITWGLICRNTETNDVESGLLSNLMIERVESNSSDETDYEEHQEENYILPIQQEMLKGDCFVKESDGWKEFHNWNKKELTGNENIALEGTYNGIAQFCIKDITNAKWNNDRYTINAYSNYFKAVAFTDSWTKDEVVTITGGKTVRFMSSKYTTVAEFKQFLQEKYTEGNPVVVYYKLETLEELSCTEEQSAILDKLNNLDLFKNTNNIITTEDIALLKLNYVVDTKTYVDNKIANMQEELDTINQLLSTTQTSSILLDNLQTDLESEVM